ncbi:MAG: hypothetical protein ACTSO2_03840 [Promethearchaeota archaeon]
MNNYSKRALRDLLGIKDRLAVERFYAIFKAMFLEKIRLRKKSHIINEIRYKFILVRYGEPRLFVKPPFRGRIAGRIPSAMIFK